MGLEKINQLRKAKELTSKQLSEQSGVPLGTLNKILSGTTKDPKLETLKAITKVLGCSLDDFDDSKVLFGNKIEITLKPDEEDIIKKYRQLSSLKKEDIRDYVDMKYNKMIKCN